MFNALFQVSEHSLYRPHLLVFNVDLIYPSQ